MCSKEREYAGQCSGYSQVVLCAVLVSAFGFRVWFKDPACVMGAIRIYVWGLFVSKFSVGSYKY
jgi:hypothetical protein